MRKEFVEITDRASMLIFRFTLDGSDLHITRRHGTHPEDAVRAFFDPTPSTYDRAHNRYEKVASDGTLLSWYWVEYGRRVQVLTCMRLERE